MKTKNIQRDNFEPLTWDVFVCADFPTSQQMSGVGPKFGI